MSDGGPKRSRATLWLVLAVAVAPVAASYLAYYVWPPGRSAAYGQLIEPRQLPDVGVRLADGSPFRLSALKGKWVLVSIDAGRCDAYCERKLLYMRQLRLTQGKDKDRIERAWLVADDAAPLPAMMAQYEGTLVVRAGGSGLVGHFPAPRSPADHVYVIDPLGNIMLRFPRDPEARRMIKDLSRLLKASRIG